MERDPAIGLPDTSIPALENQQVQKKGSSLICRAQSLHALARTNPRKKTRLELAQSSARNWNELQQSALGTRVYLGRPHQHPEGGFPK
jgi:hypothetical protein